MRLGKPPLNSPLRFFKDLPDGTVFICEGIVAMKLNSDVHDKPAVIIETGGAYCLTDEDWVVPLHKAYLAGVEDAQEREDLAYCSSEDE